MANKMLIDASHPEETRVVVLRGNRVQEFDFEAADKKPLRGNIYLAKVTRVEPSLQAAFVDYGGNRHGFLAFSEIHPDYYQIPVADRIALLEEESRAHRQAEEEEHRPQGRSRRSRRRYNEAAEKRAAFDDGVIVEAIENAGQPQGETAEAVDVAPDGGVADRTPAAEAAVEPTSETVAAAEPAPAAAEAAEGAPIVVDPSGFGVVEVGHVEEVEQTAEPDHEAKARRQDERDEEHEREREEARAPGDEDEHEEEEHEDEADHVEHIGGDAMEEVPYRAPRLRRQYKIQEVIKRRQVLLVQVVKEERGNKGAALTTYLSLAGRYSVLMPNTARGGGISRKITDGADRKRLKEIVHDLEVPEGMGVILRTAGASRTKAEVKRDFEYLLRLWESVRELTLRSSAPTLVYEEGSLIKRAIRDLYGRDVEEVVVSGDEAYREAKEFMRMLMPSHAKNVRQHREPYPIFADSGVEAQLDAMFSNHVTLKSGGYLVINQTEALVAIDVNSGRSTREHNIEDTALRTNLEAADEVARQLRLRDLAGLIVVDFIDMEESRNNRAVERRLKDALKNDRARIQVGRISHFGLLEMSRQRIRAGVIEGSTVPCPHCAGAGAVRSTASIALHVLRVLEEALVKSSAHDITLRTRAAVALYILNQKRSHLQDLEHRFGVHITVAADDTLTGAVYHALERGEPASGVRAPAPQHLRVDSLRAEPLEEEEEAIDEELIARDAALEAEAAEEPRRGREARPSERAFGERGGEEESEGQARSRRRRRRRGRGGGQVGELAMPGVEQPSDEGLAIVASIEGVPTPSAEPRPGRRGRGRGPGRWMRSSPLPVEYRDHGLFPADEGAETSAASPLEAHLPGFGAAVQSFEQMEAAAPGEAGVTQTAESAPESAVETAVEAAGPGEPAPEINAAPAVESATEVETVAEAPLAAEVAPEPAAAPVEAAPAEAGPVAAKAEVAPEAPVETAPREPTEVVITQADPTRPKKGGWWQRAKPALDPNAQT